MIEDKNQTYIYIYPFLLDWFYLRELEIDEDKNKLFYNYGETLQ